jgi:pseudaminic acid cytidylyltransferase
LHNLAIIPARGGSKRIPRKNIKEFLGKPIIVYSIETAIKSQLFDEIMVSTEDMEIAEIAVKYGANVPFMRSNECANDFASTVDVLIEVIEEYENRLEKYDTVCCIYPTAPLVNVNRLKESYDMLIDNNFDSVFPIVPFSYPVFRGLRLDNEKVQMVWPEYIDSRSQDLETIYHDAGQFYMSKVEIIKKKKMLWTNNTGAIILSELEVQDIDNSRDWVLAEMKYQLMRKEDIHERF